MSPPVFTVDDQRSTKTKARINLLPCRVHHDGDVSPIDTFWKPSRSQERNENSTAYLRGRELHGKTVKLPEGYYGSVVERTEPKVERQELAEDVELEEVPEEPLKVGAMQGKAVFDEMIVWGHESAVDSSADPYVRGMEEWISFAEQIHSYPHEPVESPK
ncbi:ribonuclease H2, subunit C [Xylariomycetidae sp. FL2044]|nr:ribonuclease H2, subunit C [Xylariomycetidae sp. FL2044]